MKQHGVFDENDRLKELSKLGDPLERLNKYIDWEQFRRIVTRIFQKEPKGPSGRPPFDYIIMFKILILQRMYNNSDAQTEYQIKDRLSFMRFLGLTLCDTVPDEKTEGKKIITYSGSIIDATFVEAPRQRNSREENQEIKEGKVPAEWEQEKLLYGGRSTEPDT
jgi:hypothetical protein